MKTFLNVLYRRILYKIPLKLLLVLLAIFWLLFAFSKAENICTPILVWSANISSTINWNLGRNWEQYYYCILSNNWQISISFPNTTYTLQSNDWICVSKDDYPNWISQIPITCTNWTCNLWWAYFWKNCISMTSLQCQTEYNLIPISSVDQNYCTSNNLCPSNECPSYTWDLMPWVSNIWINDIFHPWAFNIYMNIPQELDRDYAYTNSWANFNLDIVGYNVDYDYIEWIVDHQNYKPTSEEFSIIVSQIIPLFVPWLCIILLLYFIFRFIKKIF